LAPQCAPGRICAAHVATPRRTAHVERPSVARPPEERRPHAQARRSGSTSSSAASHCRSLSARCRSISGPQWPNWPPLSRPAAQPGAWHSQWSEPAHSAASAARPNWANSAPSCHSSAPLFCHFFGPFAPAASGRAGGWLAEDAQGRHWRPAAHTDQRGAQKGAQKRSKKGPFRTANGQDQPLESAYLCLFAPPAGALQTVLQTVLQTALKLSQNSPVEPRQLSSDQPAGAMPRGPSGTLVSSERRSPAHNWASISNARGRRMKINVRIEIMLLHSGCNGRHSSTAPAWKRRAKRTQRASVGAALGRAPVVMGGRGDKAVRGGSLLGARRSALARWRRRGVIGARLARRPETGCGARTHREACSRAGATCWENRNRNGQSGVFAHRTLSAALRALCTVHCGLRTVLRALSTDTVQGAHCSVCYLLSVVCYVGASRGPCALEAPIVRA